MSQARSKSHVSCIYPTFHISKYPNRPVRRCACQEAPIILIGYGPPFPRTERVDPLNGWAVFFFFFRLIWLPVFSDSRLNFPDRVGTGGQSQSGSQRQLILNLAHLYLSSPAPTSSASSDSFTHPTIFHHNHSIILSPTTNFLSPPPST